jgi:hypothetical protein
MEFWRDRHIWLRWILCLAALVTSQGVALGQQPAQRILPRVTPPSPTPHASAPCLPHFDDELKLYVRPCQEFHEELPRHDWLDRMIVAVTWRSGAQFLSDLMPDERTHIAPYQRGHEMASPMLRTEHAEALADALSRFAQEAESITVAAPREVGEGGVGIPSLKARLAAAKVALLGPEECSVLWPSAQGTVPLTAPFTSLLEANAGETLQVEILDVLPVVGYLAPDPVVWLVRLDGRNEPEWGTTIAVADGRPGKLPSLTATAPSTGLYRLLVAPYRAEFAGRVTLEARVDGVLQAQVEDHFFGGTLLQLSDSAAGDQVFAGATPNGKGHDAALTLLPPPGSEGILPYASSNNDIGTLPALTVPEGGEGLWILVSAFDSSHSPTIDLYQSRVGARPGRGTADGDGDGLSLEIEELLGSCDSPPEESLADCLAPNPLPAGWTPWDTDHDGFSDFEELYGVRRCYGAPAQPPQFRLDSCFQDDNDHCRSDCSSETGLIAQIPLSALDGPSPTVHDIYIELDYWQSEGAEEPGGMPQSQVELLERVFEERFIHGDGTSGGTFGALNYPIEFHLFQDEPLRLPGFRGVSHIPALAARSLFFDLFFSADRKYTGTFHYVVGTNRGGGQSDVTGRAAIVGLSGGTGSSLKLAHEIGHLLGLLHNYTSGNPDHTPFQLSIMSYGYVHTIPPPIVWDGTFRPCGEKNPCPEHFRCARFPGHGRLCSPDCGVVAQPDGSATHFGRLSAGELPLPPEASEAGFVPEEGYPKWFLPYFYCYNDAGGSNRLQDRFRRFAASGCAGGKCVHCGGDGCSIDIDQDGDFDGLRGYDLDGDGKLNTNTLADRDDHALLISRGARGLRVLSKKTLAAFYTGFGGNAGTNFLPYPAITHEHHAGFVNDPTNRCDEVARWSHCRDEAHFEAALFRGPVAGDQAIEIRLPEEYCLAADDGLTISLRVKPFQAPRKGYPVVLLAAGEMRLLLEGSAEELRWVAEYPGKDGRQRLVLSDRKALGRWTRLTLAINTRKGEASLSVRRRTTRLLKEDDGAVQPEPLCQMGIGALPGEESNFVGLLDDPMLLLGYVKTLR